MRMKKSVAKERHKQNENAQSEYVRRKLSVRSLNAEIIFMKVSAA